MEPVTIISNNELKIKNYSLVRNDRSRHGGGVALYINESISFNLCTELYVDDLELVSCRINPEFQTSFLICCFYRSPSIPLALSMDMFYHNVELATSLKLDIIILGDLNINCDTNNYVGNAVYNLCNLSNMEQIHVVTLPTRVTPASKTLIDVVITYIRQSLKH